MSSTLGVYWSVMHRRPQDYDYFKQLQPTVFKIMDGGAPDYQFARDHLSNSLVVARDWALSEQHSDMLNAPIATGQRHAREWNQHHTRLGFDRARTLILGINEPRVWEAGVPEALRLYTIALCDEAARLGLRVGAMQLSVGWPNNTGPDTPPDWSPWHGVEDAIRRGNHTLVLHEYWADNGPGENWGWWAGRALKCPWQVPIIIGECGVDMYVKDAGVAHNSRGWHGRMSPERYAQELADYTGRMSVDPRFVGCCVFASDFASHEWYSFDVEPAYQAILATHIPDMEPVKTQLPYIPNAKPTPEVEPSMQNAIDDRWQRLEAEDKRENWERSIPFVLRQEGGLSTDPNDPGNYVNGVFVGTKYGISANAHPGVDIVNLTVEQAKEIYFKDYWGPSGAATLPWPLCLAVFDLAVNGGVGRAQQALKETGHDFVKFMAWRIAWYTRIENFDRYGRAWIRRCSELMTEATK